MVREPGRGHDADRIEVVEVIEHRFPAMGTSVHAIGVGVTPEQMRAVERDVELAEARLSRFLDDSDLTRLRRGAGSAVVVSPFTIAVVARAMRAREETRGAFDPCLGSAMRSAGYDRTFEQLPRRPDAVAVPRRRRTDDVVIDERASTIRLAPGIELDLGGLAKGFVADRLVAALRTDGALGACVNIGGDLSIDGVAPDLGRWQVALDHGRPEPVGVTLTGGGVATSTTRRRRWLASDGVAWHHLLDPSTGASVCGDAATVTVIGPDATTAEILTKVAFVDPAEFSAALHRWRARALVTASDGTSQWVGAVGSPDREAA